MQTVCVFGSSSESIDKEYLDSAEHLGKTLAEQGKTVVFGGGRYGVMGAVARGVSSAGGKLIGVSPKFFIKMGVLFDEVALMPRSFVEQALARCSVSGSRFWFNCNPESPNHWFYKEWVCKAKEKGALRLHFTMGDNPGLEQSIRKRYETLYTGVFHRRYVLGQWCVAEGLVYDFQPEKYVTDRLPEGGRYFISVDYGTQNPFSAGLWCVSRGKAYRLREFYHNGREKGAMTDEEYYEALCDLVEHIHAQHRQDLLYHLILPFFAWYR